MAGPQSIRYVNEVRTLELLLREQTISRAALSKILGISPSTITKIVTELIAKGLVREVQTPVSADTETRAAGRPGIGIALNGDGAYFLGVEIGVRRLNLVLLDLNGTLVEAGDIRLDVRATPPREVIDRIVQFADAAAHKGFEASRILGCGVSIPALVDHDGSVTHAPIIGWKALPLGRLLAERFAETGRDIRIEVANDASAFAMAETARGTGKRCRTVMFMNMENGVGGALVNADRLFGGNDGFAGEIGHLRVTPPGAATASQFEDLVGEDAVLGLFARHGAASDDMPAAVAALKAGDAGAREAAEAWAEALATGLIDVVHLVNPGLVVLGGTVAPLYPYVADTVTETLAAGLVAGLPLPHFEISDLGQSGPAIGAAQLVRQHMFQIDETALV